MAVTALVLALVASPAGLAAGTSDDAQPIISVLSGRPDSVSGGDALIEIQVPGAEAVPDLMVTAAGRDQTHVFEPDESSRTLTGLVTGLPLGTSEVEVSSAASSVQARLTLTNHPQEGPVFSGPHEEPFLCETEEAEVPVIGGTLGAPQDEDCSIADRVDYFYENTSFDYVAWPEGSTEYPDDLRYFTDASGEQVPFIVRMETGTVNRAIFHTSVLHDPLAEPDPSPVVRPRNWHGGGIFLLGGGCPGGWYRQGSSTGDVTNKFMLSQGFAVMSSSLNVFGNNCNDLLASESAMMVREEFSERYGPPDHVIGWGSSGGSYQALQTADNYPGIFDGLIIGSSFPDVGFATSTFTTDSQLLQHYFASTETGWTEEEQRAVTGFVTYATAANVANDQRTNPTANCTHLPPELRYDAQRNPDGARCDVYSHTQNVYGTDPDTGQPRRPLDNVGVQYGLQALNDGTITVEQFLDLNESVGGFDTDATIVSDRTVGDTEAISAAYQTGRLTSGGGGLAEVPIVDERTYLDDSENGDLHLRYHTLSLRQRLLDANGTSANHVSLLRDSRHPQFSREVIVQMDQWLRDIAADESEGTTLETIVRNRPGELQEGCYLRDDTDTFLVQPLDRDPDSACEQQYPSGSFPREVAGANIAADVIKCRLIQPEREEYAVDFSAEQWQRLLGAFDDGVCDYTQPGVGQQGLAGTWLQFDDAGWTGPDPAGWSGTEVYHRGDRVLYDSSVWRAAWWTQGEAPGRPHGAWEEIAEAADGSAVWTPSRIFTAGEVAAHQGLRYEARWWTRNEEPGSGVGSWEPVG